MDQSTAVHIAAWLGCLAFLVMLVKNGLSITDRFKESPPPASTYMTKSDCAVAHRRAEDDVLQLRRQMEAMRDNYRTEHAAALDGLRRETKADIASIYKELKEVRDTTNSMAGEIKHINISLASIDQKLSR